MCVLVMNPGHEYSSFFIQCVFAFNIVTPVFQLQVLRVPINKCHVNLFRHWQKPLHFWDERRRVLSVFPDSFNAQNFSWSHKICTWSVKPDTFRCFQRKKTSAVLLGRIWAESSEKWKRSRLFFQSHTQDQVEPKQHNSKCGRIRWQCPRSKNLKYAVCPFYNENI